MPKNYNTTELDPYLALDRQVVHRDMNAHLWRWSFVLGRARMEDTFADFGCGSGNLLETLYRNKFRPGYYVGTDIRRKTIEQANEKFGALKFPALFYAVDLVQDWSPEDLRPDLVFPELAELGPPKHVTSFEVIEHVGKQRGRKFLENFMMCGGPDSTYYLSTPNYDPQVGAAGNHCYDSGDGRGVDVQEWDHDELNELIEDVGFEIVEEFGTFASKKDYWPTLSDTDKELYRRLKRYYDSNLVSNIMAPLVPARLGRNALRVLVRK